ncbi:triple tyrosine motif-containing protein [Daejeonella lutea]|uniref:Regulatory protein, luxR family n=1 Tax=Daejeonella lutea TaxID=572036 RepID=A0A1T5F7D3_9SPHI|nr:triple tyrosine motif-containing protein [Daejeonella lutea]SKB92076.1 regulatory protein, luxR family [Daejeonella lutea]
MKLWLSIYAFFLPCMLLAGNKPHPFSAQDGNSHINLRVKARNSDLLYLLDCSENSKTVKLGNNWKTLYFEFKPENIGNFEYSHKLNGIDENWSRWSASPYADYEGLPNGNYKLSVQIRNTSGAIVQQLSFPFIISTPWYLTSWAILAFLSSLCILFYLIFQQRLQHANPGIKAEHPEFYHIETDKVISSLQKEELVVEVNTKNKELATVTMHLVERGKLLSRVREELALALKNNLQLADSNDFKIILRMLTDAEKNRHDWEQFSIHFDDVHRNFLSVLKSQYPALSTTDLKLCAYLKLNLSSKEIAQSMNITVKGVEVSRYRLRKKLNISKDVNLFDFLHKISNSNLPAKATESTETDQQADELARFLSFFNKSMTAKFITQGGYDFSSEGIIFKGSIAHNKG